MSAALSIPDTAAGLVEDLQNADKLAEIKNNGGLKDYLEQYTAQFAKKDGGVTDEQVKELVEQGLAQFARDNGVFDTQRPDLRPGRTGHVTRPEGYNPAAAGAKLDEAGIFDSTADYLRKTWYKNNTTDAVAARSRILNEFSTVVPSEGGFLVPETLRSTLMTTALEAANIRPRATVIPMETQRVPFPVLEDTDHSNGALFGGMVAYWVEEATAPDASSAKFGRVVLDAKKLMGLSYAPNELFTDSILSFEGFLSQTWPKVLAWEEDNACTNGTGVGEPLGWRRGNAVITVAAEGGQAADTVVLENILAMYARMLPTSLGNAVWFANQTLFPELATMALSVGTGGGPVWLTNAVDGPPMSIMGRPVIFTEKHPALGDEGDLAFVDLSYYLLGDRQMMQMATSEHVRFTSDETAVRIIQRLDGRPWLPQAVTPKYGDTLSPFVQLGAR